MQILKSEAFILARHPLTESSWIVSLFTREGGKVRAVAKGGKRATSPFRGGLETLSRSYLEIAMREGRELGSLRVADLLEGSLDLFSSWETSACAFGMVEVLDRGLADHNPEEETYRLTGASLRGLRSGTHPAVVWTYFLFWFLRLHGMMPAPRECSRCGLALAARSEAPLAVRFGPSEGWACGRCVPDEGSQESRPISQEGLEIALRFQRSDACGLGWKVPPWPALKELSDIVYLAVAGFLGRPLACAGTLGGLFPAGS